MTNMQTILPAKQALYFAEAKLAELAQAINLSKRICMDYINPIVAKMFSLPNDAPFIIGISGYKRSGKDTVAKILADVLKTYNMPSIISSIAAPLKKILQKLGYTAEQLNGNNKEELCGHSSNMTPRQAMQYLGMELKSYDNIWLKYIDNEVLYKVELDTVVLIPDIRFIDEVAFINERWGIRIHVCGPDTDEKKRDTHISENEISENGADYIIRNNGSIEDLTKQIKELFSEHIIKDRKNLLIKYANLSTYSL